MDIGFAATMCAITAILLILAAAASGREKAQEVCDERQMLICDHGTKMVAGVLIAALVAGAYLADGWSAAPFTPGFLMLALACAAAVADALYALAKGVQIGPAGLPHRRRLAVFWLVLGILDLASGIEGALALAPGTRLGLGNASLLFGLALVVMSGAALVLGERGKKEPSGRR